MTTTAAQSNRKLSGDSYEYRAGIFYPNVQMTQALIRSIKPKVLIKPNLTTDDMSDLMEILSNIKDHFSMFERGHLEVFHMEKELTYYLVDRLNRDLCRLLDFSMNNTECPVHLRYFKSIDQEARRLNEVWVAISSSFVVRDISTYVNQIAKQMTLALEGLERL